MIVLSDDLIEVFIILTLKNLTLVEVLRVGKQPIKTTILIKTSNAAG